MHAAPVVEQRVAQHHTLGQVKRETGRLLAEGKQAQLLAELAVVALLGLFDTGEIGVELVLLLEAGTVDALEHLTVGVAAPVGAGDARELDGVALHAAGGIQMRAGAEVNEVALTIEADRGVLGQVVDELDLVGLLALFHEPDGFLTRKLEALKLQFFLADLAHLGLEFLQNLGRKRFRGVEVIVEAVIDRRADGKLDLGVQALHRLGEDVAGRVAVGVFEFFVLKRVLIAHDASS